MSPKTTPTQHLIEELRTEIRTTLLHSKRVSSVTDAGDGKLLVKLYTPGAPYLAPETIVVVNISTHQ
jgi:hypothetical protein